MTCTQFCATNSRFPSDLSKSVGVGQRVKTYKMVPPPVMFAGEHNPPFSIGISW